MQSILITLTTAGADTDNFSLYTDLDGYTTPIETGVSKASLVAGYVSTIVPDGATVIRVQSVSSCTNYVDFPITGITTTTTSTTTSTTTIEPTTTTTSTTTSTTTPEPTTTSTTTSTTTVSCDCTYYNVVVTSEDIDNAIGNTNPAWNNTVWAYYYDCETGTSSDVIYSSADNYYHSLCNNNLFGTPYLYNHINDAVTVVVSSTITNSLDCCSAGTTTTTSTTTSTTTIEPTTTTTSTTTSTTTPSPTAQIDITNDSYDVEIGSVNAGGASTTGGSFPNSTGNGTNVFTDISISIPGTYQIDVYITAGLGGQSVIVTDSNGDPQCQSFPSGAHTLSFTGVYIDNITNVIIHAGAGACP